MPTGPRHRSIRRCPGGPGPVIYWMSRDQRVADNWALLHAQQEALNRQVPLRVVFALTPAFPLATHRSMAFLLAGLPEIHARLTALGIAFDLLLGDPGEVLPAWLAARSPGLLVSDFSPMKVKARWQEQISRGLDTPWVEVDAHNIVPCWVASAKLEFSAGTFRPKMHKLIPELLTDIPALVVMPPGLRSVGDVPAWDHLATQVCAGKPVSPVSWINPGETAAGLALQDFVHRRLPGYATARNDPTVEGQSNLSPYLHFGHLSAQRVALTVSRTAAPQTDKDAFLEELIVRREVADNFCLYHPEHDSLAGAHAWAARTLDEHRADTREYCYDLDRFERADTHEDLWNAAQRQLVESGKMHGYLRMYWAKKILEWTATPEEAFRIALTLNDRYSLDGRDPNGITGVAWSIAGVHDRAWTTRPVYGKIRYMNRNGCKRKFDIAAYIRTWST